MDYATRTLGAHSPANEEINAAEIGNPDSIDNKDQRAFSTGGWQAAWQALESNHPDFG